jgi:hypothetical protein
LLDEDGNSRILESRSKSPQLAGIDSGFSSGKVLPLDAKIASSGTPSAGVSLPSVDILRQERVTRRPWDFAGSFFL